MKARTTAAGRGPPGTSSESKTQAEIQAYTAQAGGKLRTVLVDKPDAVLFEFIELDISAQQTSVDNGRTGQHVIVFNLRVISDRGIL